MAKDSQGSSADRNPYDINRTADYIKKERERNQAQKYIRKNIPRTNSPYDLSARGRFTRTH
ncbi:MAG: hypothetical protein COV29_02505 [Candidatus Yanofskybacteria bacterium CG10_big_fil_rev_8_21_14_0_10_36_16]|uniref:Uncharacterized protein n=1 Tax=Candidatus Yanofskybacteria bacterium CG10_big_fil_rev_8_21_14_0_10_36_16 TaxID=1975096 RepID=A0A2J0Q7R2_9BACT|nr:MAG: hypothetical protein COV29_02505 [Candidatus Yanofskybacteria bacterium CG10_big_fil_rev_8_21_14_0_10_36_16]